MFFFFGDWQQLKEDCQVLLMSLNIIVMLTIFFFASCPVAGLPATYLSSFGCGDGFLMRDICMETLTREYSVTPVVCDTGNFGDPKKNHLTNIEEAFSVKYYVYGV